MAMYQVSIVKFEYGNDRLMTHALDGKTFFATYSVEAEDEEAALMIAMNNIIEDPAYDGIDWSGATTKIERI